MAERCAPVAGWGFLAAVVALWSLAVGQPVLDVLGRQPVLLLARGASTEELLLLLAALLVALPAALAAAGLLAARLLPALRPATTAGVLVLLALLLLLAPLERALAPSTSLAWILAAGGAASLGLALRRWPALGQVLTLLALAPVVFAALFLTRPGVRELLWPSSAEPLAADPSSATPPPDVVLLILDELPLASLLAADGSVDSSLFPGFARLAALSTFHRNATAAHESTTGALPALLTGRHPGAAPTQPIRLDHPRNLFTWLAATHELHLLETVTALGPAVARSTDGERDEPLPRFLSLAADVAVVAGHVVLPALLAGGLPPIDSDWSHFWRRHDAPRLRSDVLAEWIAAIAPGERPALHAAHVLLPHVPWSCLPDGRQYASPDILADPDEAWRWSPRAWDVEQGFQRHLLQLGHVDGLMSRLLDRLESTGLLERCVLVVTADHGAAFQPGEPRRLAEPGTVADIAWVPLFIKAPGHREGAPSDAPAAAVDLLPTLAALLGHATPWPVDGRSLVDDRDDPGAVASPRRIQRLAGGSLPLPDAPPSPWPLRELRARLLGPAPDWGAVHALGRGAGLVGRRVDELPAAPPLAGRVDLPAGRGELTVARGQRSLPCFVAGRVVLPPGAAPPPELALALDGIVAAVVPLLAEPGAAPTFSCLLDPARLRDGANELAVLALLGDGRLAPLGLGLTRLLAGAEGEPLLRRTDGRLLAFDPAVVQGVLDEALDTADMVRLSGWAVDRLTGAAAEQILVLVDGAVVASAPTGRLHDLPATVTAAGAAARAGFRFEVPAAALAPGRTRLLAMSRELVAELSAAPGARWLTEVEHRIEPGEPPFLVGADGSRRPLGPGPVDGVVDLARFDGRELEILGWAADRVAARAADEILVLVDGRQVFAGHQWLPRPGLAEELGRPGLQRSGFRYLLSGSLLGGDPAGRVMVLALAGDAANELRYAADAVWLRPDAADLAPRRPQDRDGPLRALDVTGSAVVGNDGQVQLVVPRGLAGALDLALQDDGLLKLSGWAVRPLRAGPVDEVVVLVDGRSVFAGPTWIPRADVAASLGLASVLPTGFAVHLEPRWLGEGPVEGRVAVLALAGGMAQVLPAREPALWLASGATTLGPAARPGFRLEGGTLVGSDGTRRPLRNPRPRGQVDLGAQVDGRLQLVGWAADSGGQGLPALRVLVFEGDRTLAEVPVTEPRPDVVQAQRRAGLLDSGFVVDVAVPGPDRDHGALARGLVVIALDRDGAVRLPFEDR